MKQAHEMVKITRQLLAIGERLRTQDNRLTDAPAFCLQILVRDVGYDSAYGDHYCWVDSANELIIYSDDPDFKEEPDGDEWEKFGYSERWETILTTFTEGGIDQHMKENGHNVTRRAFRGQWRIYAESFYRCPEMQAIRAFLMSLPKPETDTPMKQAPETETMSRLFLELSQFLPETKTRRELELLDLLRSACAIADRKGADTNWDGFLASALKLGVNGVTPRTYRSLKKECPSCMGDGEGTCGTTCETCGGAGKV